MQIEIRASLDNSRALRFRIVYTVNRLPMYLHRDGTASSSCFYYNTDRYAISILKKYYPTAKEVKKYLLARLKTYERVYNIQN